MFTVAMFNGAYYLGRLADQGLANTFGIKTLRHGTNPLSWLSIHILGTSPSMGGAKFGGDKGGCGYQNEGRTYFTRTVSYNPSSHKSYFSYLIEKNIWVRLLPKPYLFFSTVNSFNALGVPDILSNALGGIALLTLPTIRMRCTKEKAEKMLRDPTIRLPSNEHPDIAYSTDEAISALNIGMLGTVWNSLTYKTPGNMINNPLQVITGVAQLALCGLIAYQCVTLAPSVLVAHKVAIIAGAVLGVL